MFSISHVWFIQLLSRLNGMIFYQKPDKSFRPVDGRIAIIEKKQWTLLSRMR